MDKNIKSDSIKEYMPSNENMVLIPPASEEISLGNFEEDKKPKENNDLKQ